VIRAARHDGRHAGAALTFLTRVEDGDTGLLSNGQNRTVGRHRDRDAAVDELDFELLVLVDDVELLSASTDGDRQCHQLVQKGSRIPAGLPGHLQRH
jgi:hypothetical protein